MKAQPKTMACPPKNRPSLPRYHTGNYQALRSMTLKQTLGNVTEQHREREIIPWGNLLAEHILVFGASSKDVISTVCSESHLVRNIEQRMAHQLRAGHPL